MSEDIKKLYELPRDKGIRINTECSDGSKYIIFNHIDGMYSHCTTEKGATVHLGASTELKEVEPGVYDILDKEITQPPSGFTLIELLITIAIIGILSVFFLTLISGPEKCENSHFEVGKEVCDD